ncbi:MAG: hypothetical protein ACLPTF_08665 [Steroidobacteraceae bacterium]
MWLRVGSLVMLAFCALVTTRGHAQENNDLDRIPKPLQSSPPEATPDQSNAPSPPAPRAHGKYYAEDALTLSSARDGLAVPLPTPAPSDWENRTSLDAADQWTVRSGLTATLSDRFNATEENGVDVPSRQLIRNDFREGYVTWEPLARTYLEAGRVNLRDGIALGFNPTDFFKTRTLLDQASLDPSVVREDRLGTLMLRGQGIWSGGSVSVAFAPKLYAPTPITLGVPYGLGPKFDHTNGANRILGSANFETAGLSPQVLLYHEGSETLIGMNLSRSIGQSIIAYAEWAGGNQPSLIAQSVAYGVRTGTLPADTPLLPPADAADAFRSDLALGASWSSASKVTFNIEYHYHQAGLSRQEERDWFTIGTAQRNLLPVIGELWYIRAFANDQQQPWVQQQLFLRLDWADAMIPHLELAAFAFVNLYDGSSLSQLSANYYLSDAWSLGAYASANVGGARSERGSYPQLAGLIIQVLRYF